jgi:DNA recombination protein RmuC
MPRAGPTFFDPLTRRRQPRRYNHRIMWTALIVVCSLLLLALLALVWLYADRRNLATEAARLGLQLEQSQAAVTSRDAENRQLGQDIAGLREQIRGQQRLQEELEGRFKSLASDVLKASKEDLLQLAAERFKGEQAEAGKLLEVRKKEVEALVKPIGDTLDQYRKWLNEMEKNREGAYHGLRQLVGSMHESQQQLRDETGKLVRALRRPEARGKWGELQLRRVVELAGMAEHVDFAEQVSFDGADGRVRPDMIVHLPNARRIVVDAKAVMYAYLDAIEAETDEARNDCLDRHVNQIESRVRDLATRAYAEHVGSPDFVVLFLPAEAFLYGAIRRKADLMEAAMERNVVIATPSTLVALLKAVALGWREEQIADNARRISDLGRQLHSRLATAFSHLGSLGKRLERTTEAYNKLVGSVDRQLVPSARRFEELGVQSNKQLPDAISPVEALPRESNLIPAPDTPDDAPRSSH